MNNEELLKDALQRLNAKSAVELLNMSEKNPSMNLDNITKIRLSYVRMNSLSLNRLTDLMQQSILQSYTLPDFLLSEKIETFAELLFDPEQEIELYDRIGFILSGSTERVVTQSITINGKAEVATISNFIADYINTFNEVDRDALTQLKYINNSPNVKDLLEVQRAVIKDLLKLYDKAEDMVVMWQTLPTVENPKQIEELFDIQDYYPGIEKAEESTGSKDAFNDQSQNQNVIKEEPAKAVVHQRSEQPVLPKRVVQPIPTRVNEPRVIEALTPQNKTSTPAMDVLRANYSPKGIMQSNGTNIKIKDEVDRLQEDQKKFADIQKKLDELKTRKSK